MATKDRLLQLLEENRGQYLSGQEIANTLCLSRAAVWKAVKALQSEGYCIDAVSNRGYCLSAQTDILSAQGIEKYLPASLKHLDITVLPSVGSTNSLVREKADAGAPEGTLVLANHQSAGRGRLRRSFFSPADTGIYMSLLLRPRNFLPTQAVRITTMAAVALCRAIESVCEETAEIKWVNDIYVRGKKVCGILTEGSFGLESGLLEYAVLGIGINLYPPEGGFDPDLQERAGALFDRKQDDMKNRLSAAFLREFFACYQTPQDSAYVREYTRRSFLIGKQVRIVLGDQERQALVLGIDEACRLLVEFEDGSQARYSSGEIRIWF